MDFIHKLFSSPEFMPYGICYKWNPYVIWLHAVSDGLIAAAYCSIPITLIYFVRRRRDLAFRQMFLCFAVFIFASGATHAVDIWNIWHASYWLTGWAKAATAFVSVATAIALVPRIPRALAMPSPNELEQANAALQREILEHKQTAQKFRRLHYELQQKTSELEQANRELESFSSSVSHDLRAPLRHIDGFVDLLRQDSSAILGPSSQRYLGIISTSAKRMGTLIDDLLVFSRMSRQEMQDSQVNMNVLVSEVLEEVSPETNQREIEWKIDRLPVVSGDRALLRQVWTNLISNAVKYSRNRKCAHVLITVTESDDEYCFSVQDDGVGFDMQYVDQLFGIFQRLHQAEEFEGTGIGLANVRRIVARHGGITWAEGKVNEGATFYFTLRKRSSLPLPQQPKDLSTFSPGI
jgi:signal transduction histidine kinase